jgi:copper chaperone CopZ
MRFSHLVPALALLGAASLCLAESTVKLSDVHICCGACVRNVDTTVAAVSGAKGVADQATRTVTITAPDAATAQKAVNALIAGGYFGKSSDASIKVDAPSGAPDGKVQKLEVAGVHLCCGKCVSTVKEVLGKVDGVRESTVVQKAPSFTVTGDFEAKRVFEELNKAGFSGHVAPAAK